MINIINLMKWNSNFTSATRQVHQRPSSNVAGMKHCVRYIFVIKIVTNDKQLANWFYCHVKTCMKETNIINIIIDIWRLVKVNLSVSRCGVRWRKFQFIYYNWSVMKWWPQMANISCLAKDFLSHLNENIVVRFVYTAKMFAFVALANRLMVLPFSGICSFCGHHYDVWMCVFFSAFEKQLPLTWGIMFGCLSQRWPVVDRALQSILFVHTVDVIHNINCDWLHHITRDDPFLKLIFVSIRYKMLVLGFVNWEWKAQQCNNWKTKESIVYLCVWIYKMRKKQSDALIEKDELFSIDCHDI